MRATRKRNRKLDRWFDKPPTPLILHLDVDAFFASVEQLLIPMYCEKPVAVGNGVIASCSYEARQFGLHAGMALHEARKRCPGLVILDGQYQIYRCFAEHIWQITRQYANSLETFLDEAYGDATGMEAIYGNGEAIGRSLQQQVADEVGLPVSVGLAENRMLAKIASSAVKPRGVCWIRPGQADAFLADLPVETIPGVGRKTKAQLAEMNIHTVRQLRELSSRSLKTMFGRRGEIIYERARGRDVQSLRPDALPKTISRETTFHKPTCDADEVLAMLTYLLQRAMRTVRGHKLMTGCLELNLRYEDWRGKTVRRALDEPTDCDEDVYALLTELLTTHKTRRVALRHVGIVLSNLVRNDGAKLFESPQRSQQRQLHRAVDGIRDKWGHGSVISGESIELLGRLQRDDYGFVLRTPSLTK
ncbi:MAG: DNA polymerase IV [Phycisphaerae bacterium]